MILENSLLFKGINPDDCRRMIECFNFECRKFKTGSIAADFSILHDKIGIMLSGNAVMVRYDINGNRTITERLEEQSIFGELLTFSGTSRNCIEVVCESNCEIMFVRYSELTKRCEKACRCHSMVVENLLSLMSEKAVSLSEHIEILSQRTIEGKLISFLQIIEEKTPSGETPYIPFSTTELSDYLCVNRSALQREISRLKKENILILNKRRFTLNLPKPE
jgi:CRP-like cAMP-binding protein